jgi:hypothetical protein
MTQGMGARDLTSSSSLFQAEGHAGGRQHRFMESADINAAFRELFGPLRTNIRRGMSTEGHVYALEMDSHIPGELLGTEWIPLSTHGIVDSVELTHIPRRRALFDRLLGERRPESLFAYVCERSGTNELRNLYLEVVSADGCYAAAYPICDGQGWHKRDLVRVPHRRLDPVALA